MKIFNKDRQIVEKIGKIKVSDLCNTAFDTKVTHRGQKIIIVLNYQCFSFGEQQLLFSYKEKIILDVQLENIEKDNNELFLVLRELICSIFNKLKLTNEKDRSLLNLILRNEEETCNKQLLINENLNEEK